MNKFITITTDRLLLRKLEIKDRDDCIYAILKDEWII